MLICYYSLFIVILIVLMYNDQVIEMPSRDFAQKLASSLAHHPNSALTTINLSNNPLEDRGTAPRSGPLHTLFSCPASARAERLI